MTPQRFQVVLVLNEYGDFLSDMACGLAGSLGIGASANLAFDASAVVRVAMFDAAPRDRARHRGQEPREPDGDLPRAGAAAVPDRRDPGGHGREGGDPGPLAAGDAHPRPGRRRINRQLHGGRGRRGGQAAGRHDLRLIGCEPLPNLLRIADRGSTRRGKLPSPTRAHVALHRTAPPAEESPRDPANPPRAWTRDPGRRDDAVGVLPCPDGRARAARGRGPGHRGAEGDDHRQRRQADPGTPPPTTAATTSTSPSRISTPTSAT